jgi:hypothetical protein
MKKKTAAKIVFGNKERKQFPDPEGLKREKPSSAIEGPTQPLGPGYRLRSQFSEQVSEIGMETRHKKEMANKGMKQTLRKRAREGARHLRHPDPVPGSPYRPQHQLEQPHEEIEKMSTKSFREFVAEAKRPRGRPRTKPQTEEEKAKAEKNAHIKLDMHIQHQLSKLTHPNHVDVTFDDGTSHKIPRAHANAALHHLASLKNANDRAGHAAHMLKGHAEFYHVLSKKSIPEKKNKITLAGPKLRKEEVEQIDELRGYGNKKLLLKVQKRATDRFLKAADAGDVETAKRNQRVSHQAYERGEMGEEVEQIDEKMDQAKKDEYVKRASSQASLANFTARHATGQAKTDAEKIERKRRRGLSMALKREEIEYTAEEIELYNSLSDEHKVIFEKMSRAELDKMVADYHAKGGKTKKGAYKPPKDSEKTWPASKMKGSKWASTAGSISRKNQGYKK